VRLSALGPLLQDHLHGFAGLFKATASAIAPTSIAEPARHIVFQWPLPAIWLISAENGVANQCRAVLRLEFLRVLGDVGEEVALDGGHRVEPGLVRSPLLTGTSALPGRDRPELPGQARHPARHQLQAAVRSG
jgi:hypothetical protein